MAMRLSIRTGILLVVLVVLGIYSPVIYSPLNPIDDIGIYQYLLNSDVSGVQEVFSPVGSANYYRPVLWVTFWFDKYVWGLEESFMHLGNMVFHLVNALLVFTVARKACILSGFRSTSAPLVGALLFAAHPINTEAVNWIAGRTDLLACLFLLLSVLFLLERKSFWGANILAALFFLIACLAKETAIFFLPTIMIFPFFIANHAQRQHDLGRPLWVNSFFHAVFFAGVGGAYFAFRALAFARGDAGVSHALTFIAGESSIGFMMKLRLILKAAGFYLKKLFIPFPLNFGIVHVSEFYLPIGLFVFILIVFILKKRTFSGFFFLSAISVGVSALIIPLLEATWTPLAERYMYIPSAFFVIGVILWVYPLLPVVRSKYLVACVVVSVLIMAIYGSVQRTLLWQDNLSLFQDTIEKSPSFMPAKNGIINILYENGRDDEAIAVAKTIVLPQGHSAYQLGVVIRASAMAKEGDIMGACGALEKALLDPGKYEGLIAGRLLKLYDHRMLGLSENGQELHTAMASLLSRLYELTGDSFYLYRLGQAYLFLGNHGKAKEAFTQCTKHASKTAHYYQAALKLAGKL